MSARKYVNMMEQDYVSIQKGSGYVYACANMLYQEMHCYNTTECITIACFQQCTMNTEFITHLLLDSRIAE